MRVLIVEDEQRIADNIKTVLAKQAFVSEIVASGDEAWRLIQSEEYDLIILDWMLPGMNGVEVCRRVRESGIQVPILMLTARSQLDDKIKGLDTGADDYLTKPFAMEELLARVRVLTRRTSAGDAMPVIKIADLSIDTNRQAVTRAGREIDLAPREYALLEYLARHKDHALDRLTILEHVWDENTDQFSNTVDVHIRYLRKKIDDGYAKRLIKTVKGKGYMLCAE